jgi:DNA polymerase-3 subunit epsilon
MNQATLFDLTETYQPPKSHCPNLCRQLLANEGAVIIDTETTGLGADAEVVQIAVIDMQGDCLLDTLVRPGKAKVDRGAYNIHHISDYDVRGAPGISELGLADILGGKLIVGWNIAYDIGVLKRSAEVSLASDLFHRVLDGPRTIDLSIAPKPPRVVYFDLMSAYARHWAEPGKTRQKLGHACDQQGIQTGWEHQALDDCRLVLALIRRLAEGPECRWDGRSK